MQTVTEIFNNQQEKTAYEIVREELVPLKNAVIELQEANLIKNPRIVLLGSTVSGYKEPSDIDILIIYDEIEDDIPRLNTLTQNAMEIHDRILIYTGRRDPNPIYEDSILDLNSMPLDRAKEMLNMSVEQIKDKRLTEYNVMSGLFGPQSNLYNVLMFMPAAILAAEGDEPTRYFTDILYKELEMLGQKEDAEVIRKNSRQLVEKAAYEWGRSLFQMYNHSSTALKDAHPEFEKNLLGIVRALETPENLQEQLQDVITFLSDFLVEAGKHINSTRVSKQGERITRIYEQRARGLTFLHSSVLEGARLLYGPNIPLSEKDAEKLQTTRNDLFVEDYTFLDE